MRFISNTNGNDQHPEGLGVFDGQEKRAVGQKSLAEGTRLKELERENRELRRAQ